MNILKRIILQAVESQVTAALFPLENAAPFQQPGDSLADLVQQVMKLLDRWRQCAAEAIVARDILHIDTIEKQHVKVDIQVQRGSEALDQGDRSGWGFAFRHSGLVGQMGRDRPRYYAQYLAHQLGIGGKQEAQRKGHCQHPLTDGLNRKDFIDQ